MLREQFCPVQSIVTAQVHTFNAGQVQRTFICHPDSLCAILATGNRHLPHAPILGTTKTEC